MGVWVIPNYFQGILAMGVPAGFTNLGDERWVVFRHGFTPKIQQHGHENRSPFTLSESVEVGFVRYFFRAKPNEKLSPKLRERTIYIVSLSR